MERLSAWWENWQLGLAHEINNPLGSVLAFAQILLRESRLDPDAFEAVRYIETGARRCKRVIDALVRFSHQSTAPPLQERVDLAEVACEAWELAKRDFPETSIEFKLSLEQPGPMAFGIYLELQQLARALLTNAVEAMVAIRGQRRLTLAVFQRGETACLSVRDTGHGIAANLREKIFDPFFTTKAQGEGEVAGLGLTTAYRIARSHQGTIELHSEPMQGSTFTLVLPLFDEQGVNPREAQVKGSAGGRE